MTKLSKVADRVQELSVKHPDLKEDFMNFMNNTFKREVFPSLMDDVKNINVTGSGNRLSFHPDNTRPWQLDPITPTANDPSAPYTQSGVTRQGVKLADRPLQSTVNKLNYMWEAMHGVAKISGAKDPNAYIIGQLVSERPGMFGQGVSGFPGEATQTIKNQMLAKEIEEQKKKEQEQKKKEQQDRAVKESQ
jgi:hypothetical protein